MTEWDKADAEYAARIDARILDLAAAHEWRGSYWCKCGYPVGGTPIYALHLLRAALAPGDDDDGGREWTPNDAD